MKREGLTDLQLQDLQRQVAQWTAGDIFSLFANGLRVFARYFDNLLASC